MSGIDIIDLLDTAVTAAVLGVWVYSLRERLKQQRESFRGRLQQWQHWYREDMQESLDMMQDQQETQERQQAQTEALINEHVD